MKLEDWKRAAEIADKMEWVERKRIGIEKCFLGGHKFEIRNMTAGVNWEIPEPLLEHVFIPALKRHYTDQYDNLKAELDLI